MRFQEKWRHALAVALSPRGGITAVFGDAEFGDNSTLRTTLHRAGLPYALGISSTLSVFLGTSVLTAPGTAGGRQGRPRTRRTLPARITPLRAAATVATWPAQRWQNEHVAERPHGSRVARALRRPPRHARARLAAAPPRARGLAAR